MESVGTMELKNVRCDTPDRISRIVVERSRGRSAAGIAHKLRLGTTTVANILKDPAVIAKISELKEKSLAKTVDLESSNVARRASLNEAREVLDRYAAKAARRIVKIAGRGLATDRIKLEACQDILDRVGVKGSLITEVINRNYTPEEIESAKQTLLEVESISARVTMSKSRFVLPEHGKATQTTDATTNQQDQDATVRPDQTSPDRQETVTAEPVLPL